MPVPSDIPTAPATPFPLASALDAIRALEALADGLDALSGAAREGAANAAVDWRGFTRRWFDDRAEAVTCDLRTAAAGARRHADDVRRLAAASAACS